VNKYWTDWTERVGFSALYAIITVLIASIPSIESEYKPWIILIGIPLLNAAKNALASKVGDPNSAAMLTTRQEAKP
jgi:hypothetical protein